MIKRLALLFRTFTPVEEALLSHVESALPPEAREIYVKQIAKINHVQRTLDWHEILFYILRNHKPAWDQSIPFKNKSELILARVTFTIDNLTFRAKVGAVNGFVFSLLIRPSIKPHWHKQISSIKKLVIETNPEDETSKPHIVSLPASYLKWISYDSPEGFNGWTVLSSEETYSISLADADYIVLAVREGDEYLLSLAESPESGFYYAQTDGTTLDHVAESFKSALKK